MNALEVCLIAALGLALAAVIVLAITLPRRVASIMLAAQARGDTRGLAAKAALHTASSTEVAVIVAPLRALLDEHVQRALAARESATTAAAGEVERITASLRALLDWLFAFAYSQDAAAQAAAETTRKPDRPPVSRERSSPNAATRAIAPPGSAPSLPPGPGLVAAGLGPRPSSEPLPARATAHPSVRRAAAPRTATTIGVAPPAPAPKELGDSGAWLHDERPADDERTRIGAPPSAATAPRSPLASAPTMLSMQAVERPSTRPAVQVELENRSRGENSTS